MSKLSREERLHLSRLEKLVEIAEQVQKLGPLHTTNKLKTPPKLKFREETYEDRVRLQRIMETPYGL